MLDQTRHTGSLANLAESAIAYSLQLLTDTSTSDTLTRHNILSVTNSLIETLGGKTSTSVHRHVSTQANQHPFPRTTSR